MKNNTIKVVFVALLMLAAIFFAVAGDVIFESGGINTTSDTNNLGDVEFFKYNASCAGFRYTSTGGAVLSCT